MILKCLDKLFLFIKQQNIRKQRKSPQKEVYQHHQQNLLQRSVINFNLLSLTRFILKIYLHLSILTILQHLLTILQHLLTILTHPQKSHDTNL